MAALDNDRRLPCYDPADCCGMGRLLMLWLEWFAIFILFPLLVFSDAIDISKFLLFAFVILYALIIFYRHKPVTMSAPSTGELSWRSFVRIPVLSFSLLLLAYLLEADRFMSMPREHTELWLLIMGVYPLMSALPQEFLYRKFYFWRYGRLFGTDAGLIISSTLLFAGLHLIYANLVAVLLSLLGGYLFASRYARCRKLWLPWLEHAIYGMVIFTSGLGHYFYLPLWS